MSPGAGTARASPRRGLLAALYVAVGLQAVLLLAQLIIEVRLTVLGSGSEGGLGVVLAGLASVGAYPLVGVLLLRRRPENPVGWLFCVAMLGWAVNNAVSSYVHLGALAPSSAPLHGEIAWLYTWPGFLSTAFTVLLLLLFPDGRLPAPRWGRLVRLTLVAMPVAGVAAAFSPGPLDPSLGLTIDNPLGWEGAGGPAIRLVGELGYPVALLLVVAAVVSLVQRFRRSRGAERAQLKWFVSGVAVWGGVLLFFLAATLAHPMGDLPLWGQAAQLGAVLGGIVVPVTAGIAIFRYRLYEIDRIISRTVTYALLSVVLIGLYAGGVLGLGWLLQAVTGGTGGDLLVAATTLAVAAASGPVRRRIRVGVDRRFNRSRYDASREVERFGARLRDEVDLAAASRELVGAAHATLQPSHAAVWLRTSGVAR